MSDGPVTIPGKKPGANLTAREVVDALEQYLAHHGFSVGRLEFDEGSFTFCDVIENGGPWEADRFMFFDLLHVRLRSLDSRVGRGPFSLTIKRSRTIEESRRDEPVRTLFDLWVVPQPDRSLRFHKIVSRDGGRVTYEV
jgi:hypothetical protein